jgi:hypothetical protein
VGNGIRDNGVRVAARTVIVRRHRIESLQLDVRVIQSQSMVECRRSVGEAALTGGFGGSGLEVARGGHQYRDPIA